MKYELQDEQLPRKSPQVVSSIEEIMTPSAPSWFIHPQYSYRTVIFLYIKGHKKESIVLNKGYQCAGLFA